MSRSFLQQLQQFILKFKTFGKQWKKRDEKNSSKCLNFNADQILLNFFLEIVKEWSKCLETEIMNQLVHKKLGREPWLSGYGKRLTFQRLWVQIPAPYTGWTFLHIICCKNCNVCLKRPKINKKRPWLAHFFKKN